MIKTDHLDLYKVKPINENNTQYVIDGIQNSTTFSTTFINTTYCDGDFCCNFKINFTSVYTIDIEYPDELIKNGDFFGAYRYSLAVFNGVRGFGSGDATAGIQVCSIISCLDNGNDKCGKRTNNIEPPTITQFSNYKFKKFATIFNLIEITGNFNQSSFVTSNNLLSGAYSEISDPLFINKVSNLKKNYKYNLYKRFGNLMKPSDYEINQNGNKYMFKIINDVIVNPGTISLYNRVFDWDGQNVTTGHKSNANFIKLSFISLCLTLILLIIN